MRLPFLFRDLKVFKVVKDFKVVKVVKDICPNSTALYPLQAIWTSSLNSASRPEISVARRI